MFTAALTALFMAALTIVSFVSWAVYSQSKSNVAVTSLDNSSFRLIDNGLTGQVSYRDTITVRQSCVGTGARGFLRLEVDPLHPNSKDWNHWIVDDQLLIAAPSISGITPDMLLHPERYAVLSQTVQPTTRSVTYQVRHSVPLPSGLQQGPGWHYAEITSHEACGYFHGWLPVHTNILLGPEIDWQTVERPSGSKPGVGPAIPGIGGHHA